MKYFIYTFLVIMPSCYAQKPVIITRFFTNNKSVDTTYYLDKKFIYYDDNFLISNYKDEPRVEKIIDSFAYAFILKKSYSDNMKEIRMYFYKETLKTNLEAIQKNPREIDRYSNQHDLVYLYTFDKKFNLVRAKYKNGQEIEVKPKQIDEPNFKFKKPD